MGFYWIEPKQVFVAKTCPFIEMLATATKSKYWRAHSHKVGVSLRRLRKGHGNTGVNGEIGTSLG